MLDNDIPPSVILDSTADFFKDSKIEWVKDTEFDGKNGYCVAGAMNFLVTGTPKYAAQFQNLLEAKRIFSDVINRKKIFRQGDPESPTYWYGYTQWNDEVCRSKRHLIRKLRKAARLARRRGK